MTGDFEITGKSSKALFSLRVRRGEGMALLSMDWKKGKPPQDFVGFEIEFKPPNGKDFLQLENRIAFPAADGSVDKATKPTRLSPIQMFRWTHFPYDAEVDGEFEYRVTPVFMDADDALSYGDAQTASIALGGETYPGELNVAFTRGFVSSQAFVDNYERYGPISKLLPAGADGGLDFKPTHPKVEEALSWMGFEARRAIIALLDQALADKEAQVRVVAYDFNEPDVVERVEKLGSRAKVIIDNSDSHGDKDSAETAAEHRLKKAIGEGNVKRQHMGSLQHNKTIVVDGPKCRAAVCGSTNLSWRGFFVQSNNAVVLQGEKAVALFNKAFDEYWAHDDPAGFGASPAADLTDLELSGIDASIGFSPHAADNALLQKIADDIGSGTKSSLLYSLAFLYETPGPILDSIKKVTDDEAIFVYGISDRKVGGIEVKSPTGNPAPVSPKALSKHVPEPFKSEPTGGSGARMHHKFVVIDFEKPSARVYLGSYNFSDAADTSNGENLMVIRDRRVAASYAIEAVGIFDHYQFRVKDQSSKEGGKPLELAKPPRKAGEKPWWDKYYSDPQKVRDREIFA